MTLQFRDVGPYAALAGISILWGGSFPLIKIASETVAPLGIAAIRTLAAAVVLMVWMLLRRRSLPRSPHIWLKLVLLSVVGQVLPFFMLGVAGRLTTSIDMALSMGAVPLFVFILGRWIPPAESWDVKSAIGLALGFLGVAVSLGGPPDMGQIAPWGGRTAALVAAAAYALGALLSRNLSEDVDTGTTVTASMMISAAILVALRFGFDPSLADVLPPPRATLALVILGVANTALAYVVYFGLIRTSGATFAGTNNYLVPPIGILMGALALGEPIGSGVPIGLILIIVGVVLVGRRTEAGNAGH